MSSEKDWKELNDTLEREGAFANIRKREPKKVKIRTRELTGVMDVEVSGMTPTGLSARVEGDYLCIREKRGGLARIIPGKLVQKVYMPESLELDEVTSKRSGGVLHCRLIKKG